jgi:hypothetical protein
LIYGFSQPARSTCLVISWVMGLISKVKRYLVSTSSARA